MVAVLGIYESLIEDVSSGRVEGPFLLALEVGQRDEIAYQSPLRFGLVIRRTSRDVTASTLGLEHHIRMETLRLYTVEIPTLHRLQLLVGPADLAEQFPRLTETVDAFETESERLSYVLGTQHETYLTIRTRLTGPGCIPVIVSMVSHSRHVPDSRCGDGNPAYPTRGPNVHTR